MGQRSLLSSHIQLNWGWTKVSYCCHHIDSHSIELIRPLCSIKRNPFDLRAERRTDLYKEQPQTKKKKIASTAEYSTIVVLANNIPLLSSSDYTSYWVAFYLDKTQCREKCPAIIIGSRLAVTRTDWTDTDSALKQQHCRPSLLSPPHPPANTPPDRLQSQRTLLTKSRRHHQCISE